MALQAIGQEFDPLQLHKVFKGEHMFIVVAFGEFYASAHDKQSAFYAAQELVDQHITDHFSSSLPLKLTPELARAFDIRVYHCTPGTEMELPLQQWVDENFRHRQEYQSSATDREYEKYLALREKFESRFQQELVKLPNCS